MICEKCGTYLQEVRSCIIIFIFDASFSLTQLFKFIELLQRWHENISIFSGCFWCQDTNFQLCPFNQFLFAIHCYFTKTVSPKVLLLGKHWERGLATNSFTKMSLESTIKELCMTPPPQKKNGTHVFLFSFQYALMITPIVLCSRAWEYISR